MGIKINKKHLHFLNIKFSMKFINLLMRGGKKNIAKKIFLNTLVLVQSENKHPIQVLVSAINNIEPVVEIRSIRMRRTTYQVPNPLKKTRRISLALKWIIQSAKKRKGSSMVFKLKNELFLASNKQGENVKKKLAIHR